MRKIWKNIFLAGTAALALAAAGYGLFKNTFHKEESPEYKYLVSLGIDSENARILVPKINPELTDNEREFADIISKYSPDLQKICVTSDILDNGHISKAELKATRKATLEGIVNPEEAYAVLANAPGDTSLRKYSQRNTESALRGLLSFYTLLKSKGVDDEHINLLVYNPSGISINPGIEIDEESTKINFIRALQRLNSDKNDSLYVVFSSPTPSVLESGSNSYIKFEGELLSNNDLLYALSYKDSNPKYKRAIVIGQTFGAKKLLSNIPRSVLLLSEEPFTYLANVFTITSPNDDSGYNNDFLTDLSKSIQKNSDFSIKRHIERENLAHPGREKAEVFYYNQNGENRSPFESRLYSEPFPF